MPDIQSNAFGETRLLVLKENKKQSLDTCTTNANIGLLISSKDQSHQSPTITVVRHSLHCPSCRIMLLTISHMKRSGFTWFHPLQDGVRVTAGSESVELTAGEALGVDFCLEVSAAAARESEKENDLTQTIHVWNSYQCHPH